MTTATRYVSIVIMTILLFGMLVGCGGGGITPTDTSRFTVDPRSVVAANDFGFRLLADLLNRDSGKNVFVSPPSIALALAMTFNGSEGTTRDAMAKCLGLENMSLEEVNQSNMAWLKKLQSSDPQLLLTIANSLWVKLGLAFNPAFLQRNQQYYNAEVSNVAFTDAGTADRINQWVSDKTNGKIPQIVNSTDLTDLTLLVLINAIYFKGKWTTPFDSKDTSPANFTLQDSTQKQVSMMHQSGRYSYYATDQYQAISLPYGSEKRMSLYCFLPAKTSSLSAFHQSLTYSSWSDLLTRFQDKSGSITLPRFKSEYKIDLKDPLSALGMGIAFTDQANFQGMFTSTDLQAAITAVRHKTYLEINEEGTEAAAVTGVIVGTTSINTDTFDMVVDRPFFCAIRDNQTGAILFMGDIVNP